MLRNELAQIALDERSVREEEFEPVFSDGSHILDLNEADRSS
jgi:hypothetical protein